MSYSSILTRTFNPSNHFQAGFNSESGKYIKNTYQTIIILQRKF